MTRMTMGMVLGVLALGGSLEAQSAERRTTGAGLRLNLGTGDTEMRGELLAVSVDSLWVGRPDGSRLALRLPDVAGVQVRTHGAGASWTLKRVLVGWGLTSLGMTVACMSESNGCEVVPFVMAVPWGLVGGVAAWTNERSTWQRFSPDHPAELRPYARFPQGLPEDPDR